MVAEHSAWAQASHLLDEANVYRLGERHPGIADWLDRISIVVLANTLWIVVSLPLVTCPIATVGLFGVMGPLARGEFPELLPKFFGSIRRHWLSAMLLALIDLVFVLGAVSYSVSSQGFPIGFAVLIIPTAMVFNLYVFPLLTTFELPLSTAIIMSVRLALGHLFWSLLVAIASWFPLAISFVFPAFLMVGAFSTSALIASWGTWQVMKRYSTGHESDSAPSF
jgi:uncharacterized membrane protein YesL